MEIRIGVTQSPKEIEIDLADDTAGDDLVEQITSSVGAEGSMLWLTDRKGRRVGVPSPRIAYVELSSATEERRVGFGAALR